MATAQDILKVCSKQVGIKESPSNSNNVKFNTWFYGHAVYGSNYSWCSVYLAWSFNQAGAGKLCTRNSNAAYFQDDIVNKCGGKWIMKKNKSSTTRKDALKKYQPGDIVCFDFGAYDAWRDHVGIIRSVNIAAGTVQCYEGNTSISGSQSNGGMVCLKTRSYHDICACARPSYEKAKTSKPAVTVTPKTLPKTTITLQGATRRAVDISAWQGKVSYSNFLKVKKAGYDTAIIRSSYTTQGSFKLFTDKVFVHNLKNAMAAGLTLGTYHYSQAINESEGKKEAAYAIKLAEPFKKYLAEGITFDTEFGGRLNSGKAKSLGKTGYTNVCKKFCKAVKKAGFEPMVYANRYTLDNYLDKEELKKLYRIWLAQYADSTNFKGMYMWQHSSSGRVPGLTGNIDINKIYGIKKTIVLHDPNGQLYSGKLPTGLVSMEDGSGTNVRRWQKFLAWCFGETVCQPDGAFGPVTDDYTRQFQKAFGLEDDGQVGSKTLAVARLVRK